LQSSKQNIPSQREKRMVQMTERHFHRCAGLIALLGITVLLASCGGGGGGGVPSFSLNVSLNGNGTVASNPAGINCTTGNQGTCQKTFSQGTQVTLAAAQASGWQFSNWAGCDSVNGNQCTVTMNANKNVTATFTQLFTLTVTKNGNGIVTSNPAGINCGSDCSEAYPSGTIVTLIATPDTGWQFSNWAGCDSANGNQCTLTMNGSKNVTANFVQGPWAKTYGGGYSDVARSIQQTSDGGYIVAGWTLSFGAGGLDFWVLKLDASGQVQWQKTYGGGYSDVARSIQQTSDGGYIVAGWTLSFGAGNYDVWVLKLNASGNVVWQKTYGGGSDDYAESIQQTSDGGYIVAGETWSFGAGSADFWVLKLDANGNVVNCTPSNLVQNSNGTSASTSITPSTSSATPATPSPTITSTNVAGQDSGATSATQCTG
jgi:hypothetical protein